jgi:hypothetical protein
MGNLIPPVGSSKRLTTPFHWQWELDWLLARQSLAKKIKHFGELKKLAKLVSFFVGIDFSRRRQTGCNCQDSSICKNYYRRAKGSLANPNLHIMFTYIDWTASKSRFYPRPKFSGPVPPPWRALAAPSLFNTPVPEK